MDALAQRYLPRRSDGVDPHVPTVLLLLPFRLHQLALLQALQRWIERPFLHRETTIAHLLDETSQAITMGGLPCNQRKEDEVEAEVKAVAEAGSIGIGSHIHIKVQKAKEKVQKAKAKEKASTPVSTLVMVQDMVQKAAQRVQASMVQKVAVSLQ